MARLTALASEPTASLEIINGKEMYRNDVYSILACLLWPATAIHSMCLTSPIISLEAGQSVCLPRKFLSGTGRRRHSLTILHSINAPQSTRCYATMNFGDSSFLPLRFNYSTTQCDGQMIATFTTPAEVPSGEADILW